MPREFVHGKVVAKVSCLYLTVGVVCSILSVVSYLLGCHVILTTFFFSISIGIFFGSGQLMMLANSVRIESVGEIWLPENFTTIWSHSSIAISVLVGVVAVSEYLVSKDKVIPIGLSVVAISVFLSSEVNARLDRLLELVTFCHDVIVKSVAIFDQVRPMIPVIRRVLRWLGINPGF
ncbi:hypothetical protein ACP275_03G115800 [Erythranthe tilingii]